MVKMELEGNELLDFVENEQKSQETANERPASGRAKDYFYVFLRVTDKARIIYCI